MGTWLGLRDTTRWPFDYVLKVQLGGHSIIRNSFSPKDIIEWPPNYFILKFFSSLTTQPKWAHDYNNRITNFQNIKCYLIIYLIILTLFTIFLVWRPMDEHLALSKKIPWIWKNLSQCCWRLKKMRRHEFTSLSVGWIVDCVLCNLRSQVWIASSTTFVKIVYYCAINISLLWMLLPHSWSRP